MMCGPKRWLVAGARGSALSCACAWAAVGMLAVSVSGAPDAQADEVAARQAIVKLLDVGWKNSSQARGAADAQARDVLELAPRNPAALAAVWLTLMQQRRYDEALDRVAVHLTTAPGDLPALRAKAWLQTLMKNYAAASVTLDDLVGALPKPPDGENGRQDYDEVAGFLGRMCGFLGGPVAEIVNQDERKGLERRIVAQLDTSGRRLFEEARNGVVARHVELTGESADSREAAAAFAAAENQKTLADVEADRAAIEKRMQELQEQSGAIQSELKSELSEIAAKDQPLARDLARLSARADNLSVDLINYSAQMARWQQLAAAERDPARRQQYLFEADSLALVAARLDNEMNGLQIQRRAIQQQRAALASRQAQAQSAAAGQVQRLERELAGLAKRERRNDGLEKRAARPVAVTSGKARSLSAQAAALSTYDTFPLEATKAKLLDSLQ